jgi:hypothetical protein
MSHAYPAIREQLADLDHCQPGLLDSLMGRRIPSQEGYAPARMAAMPYLAARLLAVPDERKADFHNALFAVVQQQRDLGFPVWHLNADFARMAEATTLADDLDLTTIGWFSPAGTVLLPEEFSRRWFAPFACPAIHFRVVVPGGLVGCPDFNSVMEVRGPRLMLFCPLVGTSRIGADLAANLPLEGTLREALDRVGDVRFSMRDDVEEFYRQAVAAGTVEEITPEQESEGCQRLMRLGLLLGLVVSSQPGLIVETGPVLRRRSHKGSREIPELRGPCWLGRRLAREFQTAAEREFGRHWRMTCWLRRGHLRSVRHGPGRTLSRQMWIPPVLCRRQLGREPSQPTQPESHG